MLSAFLSYLYEGMQASPLLVKYTHKYENGSRTWQLTQTPRYDGQGRITSCTEQMTGAGIAYTNTQSFAYNGLNQITAHTVNGTVTTYEYDTSGRITKKGSKSYAYKTTGKDKGRIDSYGGTYYDYDFYGKPTSFVNLLNVR